MSGINSTGGTQHAGEIASMALDMVSELGKGKIQHNGKPVLVRIGVHTGSVATGIVGSINPSYSVVGPAVETASRMESTGDELRIQISEDSYKQLASIGGYIVEERKDGLSDISGIKTYWLVGRTEKAVQRRQVYLSTRSLRKCQSISSLTNTDIFINPLSDANCVI